MSNLIDSIKQKLLSYWLEKNIKFISQSEFDSYKTDSTKTILSTSALISKAFIIVPLSFTPKTQYFNLHKFHDNKNIVNGMVYAFMKSENLNFKYCFIDIYEENECRYCTLYGIVENV